MVKKLFQLPAREPAPEQTSDTNPISVDWIEAWGVNGRLGITFAPGKKGPSVFSAGNHNRDTRQDTRRLREEFRTDTFVNLMEPDERALYGCGDMPDAVRRAGMLFVGVPVPDMGVVDREHQAAYDRAVLTAARAVNAGASVVVSCRGGRGRAGTFAACALTALGMTPAKAIAQVRMFRQGAIETISQERYIQQSGYTYYMRYRDRS